MAKKRGPNKDTKCPLRKMGTIVPGMDGWTLVNATSPALVSITEQHVQDAIPGDYGHCVLALALYAAFGAKYRYEVGPSIVKVIDDENLTMLRFATPLAIQRALKQWDKPPHIWTQPAGVFALRPLPKSWKREYDGKKKPTKKRTRVVVRDAARRAGVDKTIVRGLRSKRKRAAPTRIVPRRFWSAMRRKKK